MFVLPQLPPKVQFLEPFSFPIVTILSTPKSTFAGGRKGYDKERLLFWLLLKQSMHWDYRTVAALAGCSHPTLIRANTFFLTRGIYQHVFIRLVKTAYKEGLITGKYIAMDSSFVETFSGKQEVGSEGFNGYKKAYGFKMHVLIDAQTGIPIAVTITNGLASDGTLAIPLLKKARAWLRNLGYVLADKAYDDTSLVNWIIKELSAKAGIPIRKKSKLAKGKRNRYGNLLNWQLKAVGRIFRKSILNRRTSVERLFALLKRVYHLGKEEMRGILNFAKQVYLSLISYMLKRFYLAGIRQI